MNLNEELFEFGKNNEGICKIIDSDYVLITKKMPIQDSKLKGYIESISKAKKDGIKISEIVDYKLIDGSASSFNNGVSFSSGVFIEDRAKGNSFYFKQFYVNEDNIKDTVNEYMNTINFYIDELERRSEADESVYEKLVSDIITLPKYNIEVDPKPLNFFFDEEEGYTIIDPIPYSGLTKKEYYPNFIKSIVFGYGISHLYLDNTDISMMSNKQFDRYKNAKKVLLAKVEIALLKNGFTESDLQIFEVIRNEKEPEIVDSVDMIDYVEERFEEHKGFKI